MLKLSNIDSKSGTKTDRAAQWSIPVVNHTWLEDCFVNWRNLSVGQEKYVRFSPACDCSGFLGDKGIGRAVILDDAEQNAPTQDLNAPTGSIREVEEAIAVDDNDLETGTERPRVKDEDEDVEMVDGDVLDAGADTGADVPPKRERTASPSPVSKKRRRSGDAKPSAAEENDSSTPRRPALTGRRTHSQDEVAMPPHPDRASPRKDKTPVSAKVKKSISHKLVASESTVSAKRSTPVKAKARTRKSVPAVEEEAEEEAEAEEEEEEPASTKRAKRKKIQKRRDESESEEEHERPEKPAPGPSNPKPTQATKATQRPLRESPSPSVHRDDAPLRGRRSAAQKADEKLKDIMPDVINFQKQMKRGTVVGEWEKAAKEQDRADKKTKEKEKSKENARDKAKEAAKRRRSDVRYYSSELIFRPTQDSPL